MGVQQSFERYVQNLNSIDAIIVDVCSVVDIINFYGRNLTNENVSYNYVTSSYLVTLMNLVKYEILQFLEIGENLNKIDKSFRRGIHQFRKNDFSIREKIITDEMGLSIDFEDPKIDFSYYIINNSKGRKIYSTNILDFYLDQNNFVDNKKQKYFDDLMNFFRTIYELLEISNVNYMLKNKNIKTVIPAKIFQPYSFVSVIKNSEIKEKRILLRLLIGFSQLGSILILFDELIELDDNSPSYITYFFTKMLCCTIDETLDNIDNYIFNSTDEKTIKILNQITNLSLKEKEKIRKIRNNFHYKKQDRIFKDGSEINEYFESLLSVSRNIHNNLAKVLSIKYRSITFSFFRLLRWSGYGLEK